MIVMDCSYTLALVMPDERQPSSAERALPARLFVPSIWPLEVANALRNVVRRRRLNEDQVPTVCARIEAYEIEVAGGQGSVRQCYLAAKDHDLTAYDAAYLQLALERRCMLATLDAGLAEAARRSGLTVID